MDVLSDVLDSARLDSALLGIARLPRPWGVRVDPMRQAAIHVVQEGGCWLSLAGAEQALRLAEGDVILVASGIGHILGDPADAPASDLRDAMVRAAATGGTGPATTLLCARYRHDGAGPHPIVALLPPLIHLKRSQIVANEALRLALDLLRVEASGAQAGADVVVPRLLDSVLVFLLRAWIESQPPGAGGWFGALRDKGVAKALRLIHEQPAAPWTVASLAAGAVQSRATFARRFTRLVGEPPLAYVARWRLNLAAKALRDSDRTVEEIARAVGYESGPALSKAFSRLFGQAPGRYRAGRGGDAAC